MSWLSTQIAVLSPPPVQLPTRIRLVARRARGKARRFWRKVALPFVLCFAWSVTLAPGMALAASIPRESSPAAEAPAPEVIPAHLAEPSALALRYHKREDIAGAGRALCLVASSPPRCSQVLLLSATKWRRRLMFDGLGSERTVTNSSQTVTGTAIYEGFGRMAANPGE